MLGSNIKLLAMLTIFIVSWSALILLYSVWYLYAPFTDKTIDLDPIFQPYGRAQDIVLPNFPPPPSEEKRDWHDYLAMKRDAKRVGLGEHGEAAKLNNSMGGLQLKLYRKYGFDALLSDSISVNRSLPDARLLTCKKKLYLSVLPMASIIIIFFNEYLSVLQRSVHSVINRSPPELIKEVILVDDYSDRDHLHKPLEDYIAGHFTNVRIIRQPRRMGLMAARTAGARNATAEILVFLDSHIEANHNWLPPLLEPIALNKRIVVTPSINAISFNSFSVGKKKTYRRDGFMWNLVYMDLPRLPEDLKFPDKPFKSPIMMGGLFALASQFFWELGGYDEGLDIYGGEQYELSFKIWMCGGELYNVPCSHVAHIYNRNKKNYKLPVARSNYFRKLLYYMTMVREVDLQFYCTLGHLPFASHEVCCKAICFKNISLPAYFKCIKEHCMNMKRMAQVWMDDFKQFVQKPLHNVNAGDLTKQKALRSKLKCKSFKWYLKNVAFDIVDRFPPYIYASGAIQNLGNVNMCVDVLGNDTLKPIGLHHCARNLIRPKQSQFWVLSPRKELRLQLQNKYTKCLEVHTLKRNAPVWQSPCHRNGGNQYWNYDYKTGLLQYRKEGERCLEMLPLKKTVVVNACNKSNMYMQWNIGFVNRKALKNIESL